MRAKGFIEEGKTTPSVWKCTNCNTFHKTLEGAENCCKPVYCTVCGKEICRDRTKCTEYYYNNPIRCGSCYRQEQENKYPVWTETEYLEKTKNKASGVFNGDHYYEDLYDCLQGLYDDGVTKEDAKLQRINPCEECHIERIEIDRELERVVENMGLEDPEWDVIFSDLKELYDYINRWNNKQNFTYYVPLNIHIQVDDKTIDEYWEEEE